MIMSYIINMTGSLSFASADEYKRLESILSEQTKDRAFSLRDYLKDEFSLTKTKSLIFDVDECEIRYNDEDKRLGTLLSENNINAEFTISCQGEDGCGWKTTYVNGCILEEEKAYVSEMSAKDIVDRLSDETKHDVMDLLTKPDKYALFSCTYTLTGTAGNLNTISDKDIFNLFASKHPDSAEIIGYADNTAAAAAWLNEQIPNVSRSNTDGNHKIILTYMKAVPIKETIDGIVRVTNTDISNFIIDNDRKDLFPSVNSLSVF